MCATDLESQSVLTANFFHRMSVLMPSKLSVAALEFGATGNVTASPRDYQPWRILR